MNWGSTSTKYRRISVLLLSLSVLLSSVSITFAEPKATTYGLIQSLSPAFFVALFLLTVSFLITLRFNMEDRILLGLHLVALVVLLYFLPAVVEKTPRFPAAYHVHGHTDYVMRSGQADPSVPIATFRYQYFPGLLFIGAAMLDITDLAPVSLLMWFPIVFELMCLPLLYLVLRNLVGDQRLIWLALWIYYVASWINRAYYSSQACGYFLFIFIMSTALLWLFLLRKRGSAVPKSTLVLLVITFAAIATTHLLSAIAALACLVVLILLFEGRRIRSRSRPAPLLSSAAERRLPGLGFVAPFLLAGIMALWLYRPQGFLSEGQAAVDMNRILLVCGAGLGCLALAWLLVRLKKARRYNILVPLLVTATVALALGLAYLHNVFDVSGMWESTVQLAFGGGAEHAAVMRLRAAYTLGFCALAICPVFYAVYRRRLDFLYVTLLGLLVATCSMILLAGSYSGEIIYRAFQFSLPFLALLAARNYASGTALSAALLLFLVAAPPLFVAAAYGNEKSDYIAPAEISGVEFFYDNVSPDSQVHSLTERIWDFKYIERQYWQSLDLKTAGAGEDNAASGEETPRYLLDGERDIEARVFLAGDADIEKLELVRGSPDYVKVYSSKGYDLFKQRGN